MIKNQTPDGWLRAVDEALVVAHLGVADAEDSYEMAKCMLNKLIGWHTDVATDPAVNGGFKLVPIEPTQKMRDAWSLKVFQPFKEAYNAMLAAAPEAKPAPSGQDATWFPVPDKHPTFDPVDLQLADGSVLCGCLPQSDGDYWWKGPSGEVFIDPRYASVTHWRLAAVPEAKPCP